MQKNKNKRWDFVHDNAPIHKSKETVKYLSKVVNIASWLPCSPDENRKSKGNVSRKVYKNNKHYTNMASLKSAILRAWKTISSSECEKLAESMKERMYRKARQYDTFLNFLFHWSSF